MCIIIAICNTSTCQYTYENTHNCGNGKYCGSEKHFNEKENHFVTKFIKKIYFQFFLFFLLKKTKKFEVHLLPLWLYPKMTQQPNYEQMNEQIAFIQDTMERASGIYSDILESENGVAFEAYTELHEVYTEITDAISDYFEYLSTVGIQQKDSYLFEWLYGKYYRIESIQEIAALLKDLDEQACAEELSTNLNPS